MTIPECPEPKVFAGAVFLGGGKETGDDEFAS
jgi:hypothetical protein